MLEKVMSYIPDKLKDTVKWEMAIKRIIYIAGFAGLVMIDQIIGSATGYVQYGLKNYTGVIMAFIILTAYRLKDFKKIPYIVWSAGFLIVRFIYMAGVDPDPVIYMKTNTFVWNIGIWGVVLIRMFYLYVIERKHPRMNWSLFGMWLFMMLWMVLVQTETTWQLSLLIFFSLFYLTNFREKDLNNLYCGMAEGIIVGFLIVQGQAFMYRPYDVLRYLGMYSNSNINALFYVFSYCAVLCKWYQMKLRRRHIVLRFPLVVLAGMMWALTFLTMGRTALITMAVITIFFLLFQVLSRKKGKILELLLDGGVLLIAIVVCFVPTYNMVRYIPAYVDEPKYFESDNADAKIQKGESIDSEKYIDFDTVLEASFGRLLWFLEDEEKEATKTSKIDWKRMLGPSLVVQASDWYDEYWYAEDEVYIAPGTDSKHPVLTKEEGKSPVKIRMTIYEHYLKALNLTGKHEEGEGVWVTTYYYAPHAHNILLQMAFDFGWPVGILFFIIILTLYNKVLLGISEEKRGAWYYRLFVTVGFTTGVVVFGMLEINWLYGQLPFTMFFVIQYILYHQRNIIRNR